MIEENERGLRREKRYVTVRWFFLLAMAVTFLTAGGFRSDRPLGTFFGSERRLQGEKRHQSYFTGFEDWPITQIAMALGGEILRKRPGARSKS